MKLAFNGSAHYTDFSDGYGLYVRRSRGAGYVDQTMYNRILRNYCKRIADKLLDNGIVDLPGLGSIAAVLITRKPQYRGDKFVGYGKMDWNTGHYDGKLKAFGLSFLPRRDRNSNLRCFGFVANRRLFKKMKEQYLSGESAWQPIALTNEMI